MCLSDQELALIISLRAPRRREYYWHKPLWNDLSRPQFCMLLCCSATISRDHLCSELWLRLKYSHCPQIMRDWMFQRGLFISRTPTNVRPVWVCRERTLCRYLWKPHQSGTVGTAGGRKRAEWIPQSKDHRCTQKKPVYCKYNAFEMVKWFRWLDHLMLWQILCCAYVTLIFQTSSNLS